MFCLVGRKTRRHPFKIDHTFITDMGGSDGTSIVNAYGVSDISEECGLPDQMATIALRSNKQHQQQQQQQQQLQKQPEFLEVIQDFNECSSALQLPVQAGEIVTFIGSEGSWVFVRTTNGADGYIPRRSCRVIRNRSDVTTLTHAHNNHDASDVGYYSDHHNNDNHLPNSSNKNLNAETNTTSSNEMSDGRCGSDDNETTASIRDLRRNYLEATRHIRSVSDCVENATWERQETRQNPTYGSMTRVTYGSNTISGANGVCGRKCGERCIHKSHPDVVQSVGRTSCIHLHNPQQQTQQQHTQRSAGTLEWDEYACATARENADENNQVTGHLKNRDRGQYPFPPKYPGNSPTNNSSDDNHERTHREKITSNEEPEYRPGRSNNSHENEAEEGENDEAMQSRDRGNLLSDDTGVAIEKREDRERLQRRLVVNKKVVNHVRNTLDNHKRVQKKVSSYWRQTEAKILRKSYSKKDVGQSEEAKEEEEHEEDALPLCACGHPELIVIKDYDKAGDTDISVGCGDFATIVDDRRYTDWLLVLHESGKQGYIPTDCTLRHECKECASHESSEAEKKPTTDTRKRGPNLAAQVPDTTNMKRLICVENFNRDYPNYLKVSAGECVYMDENLNWIEERLWVYSPRQQSYGYVPAMVLKDLSEVETITV